MTMTFCARYEIVYDELLGFLDIGTNLFGNIGAFH